MVLEGLAELDDLGPFRVDGERGNDHVRPFIVELSDEAVPFLFARPVLGEEAPELAVRGQGQRVSEVVLPCQLFEEIDAVALPDENVVLVKGHPSAQMFHIPGSSRIDPCPGPRCC